MPHISHEIRLDFGDVLIRPKRSTLRSRSEVDLVREFTFRHSKRSYAGVPVMASNMDTTGTWEVARELHSHQMFTCIHKHYELADWEAALGETPEITPNIAVSCGTGRGDRERVRAIMDALPDVSYICLDVANGYSEHFVTAVRQIREEFADKTLIAGNVVTAEMTEELLLSGADIVKVGIGPGSVCTTRLMTGVGMPQLSAIIECADAAHGLNGHIIGDGGCKCPGDVAKAFAGGSDFVMLGGMLAGHDESGGELVERDGRKFKMFYGMSSATAMKKHSGGVAEYRASEGKTVEMPYRGPLRPTALQVLGGVRSTCTYVGAAQLRQLSKRTTFLRVNRQVNPVFNDLRTDRSHGYSREEASPPAAGGGGAAADAAEAEE